MGLRPPYMVMFDKSICIQKSVLKKEKNRDIKMLLVLKQAITKVILWDLL